MDKNALLQILQQAMMSQGETTPQDDYENLRYAMMHLQNHGGNTEDAQQLPEMFGSERANSALSYGTNEARKPSDQFDGADDYTRMLLQKFLGR